MKNHCTFYFLSYRFIIKSISIGLILSCLSCETRTASCTLSQAEAYTAIDQVQTLLEMYSPYWELHTDRVVGGLETLKASIADMDSISKPVLHAQLKKSIAALGDRHHRTKLLADCEKKERIYFPFTAAPLADDQVVALRKEGESFAIYHPDYPLLKAINGAPIMTYIATYNSKDAYAPKKARLLQGVRKLNKIYKYNTALKSTDTLAVTLSRMDATQDTILRLPMVTRRNEWKDIADKSDIEITEAAVREQLFRWYPNQIAYLQLPLMYGKDKQPAFFEWLTQKMETIKESNALVIDIRNNTGGNRELLAFFANYLVPPNTHWVANVARYKGKLTDDVQKGFAIRLLHPYEYFTVSEQQAIDRFRQRFVPSVAIDDRLFTPPHYMVLTGQKRAASYYYEKPVYILINEKTFSAASVFAAAFKGLPRVQLAGVCTDGSSGMSKAYKLDLPELRIALSHMLSFQSNGHLFDGYGTQPDHKIDPSLAQVLGKEDHQLQTVLDSIQTTITAE